VPDTTAVVELAMVNAQVALAVEHLNVLVAAARRSGRPADEVLVDALLDVVVVLRPPVRDGAA
jgi:hypothetical protein